MEPIIIQPGQKTVFFRYGIRGYIDFDKRERCHSFRLVNLLKNPDGTPRKTDFSDPDRHLFIKLYEN